MLEDLTRGKSAATLCIPLVEQRRILSTSTALNQAFLLGVLAQITDLQRLKDIANPNSGTLLALQLEDQHGK